MAIPPAVDDAGTRARSRTLAAYRRAARQVHLDFHTPDDAPGFLGDFAPDEFAQTMRAARVQGVKIFGKCACGNSYYDTIAGRRHPQLGRDLLREMAEALHRQDIACYAHYAVLQDHAAAREHPEWCVRSEDGSIVAESLCPNTPYLRRLALPQLAELCAYPIDGVFLDIVYYPNDIVGCLCEGCRGLFREETGRELTGDTFRRDLQAVTSFRNRSLRRMFAACQEVRDRLAPAKLILANHAHVVSSSSFDPEGDQRHAADAGVAESQPAVATMYACGVHYCRILRTKRVPFEIIPVRFLQGWGEGNLKPLVQMNYENALIAANGGAVSIGDHLPPSGRLDARVYARIGASFDFLQAREPFLRGTAPARYAAVLQMADSPYWNRAAAGAERLLDDLHVQTDVLDAASFEQLDGYRVLFLPDRRENPRGSSERRDACVPPNPGLSARQLRRLAEWVAAGGRLIVSGDALSGLAAEAELVEGLLGVRLGAEAAAAGYLLGTGDAAPAAYDGFPLQVGSPFMHAEPTTARALLGWCRPLVFSRTDCSAGRKRMPGERAATDAVFLNRHGRGQVLYTAFPLCLEYAQTRAPWLPEVFAHLAAGLLGDRPVLIDGHPSLHANLRHGPRGTSYLDLIYAHAEPAVVAFPEAGLANYPVIREEYPLPGVRILVRGVAPLEVTLEPGGRPLEWQQVADGILVTVPEVRTYDIVRIAGPPAA